MLCARVVLVYGACPSALRYFLVLELLEEGGSGERRAKTHSRSARDHDLKRHESRGVVRDGIHSTRPRHRQEETKVEDGARSASVVDELLTLGQKAELLDGAQGGTHGLHETDQAELLRRDDRLADEAKVGRLGQNLGLALLGSRRDL